MTPESAVARQYNRWAATYDRRWRGYTDVTQEFLLNHLVLARHHDILDVGCGTGTLLRRLFVRYPQAHAIGIDASDGMLRLARENLAGWDVALRRGRACRLPVADDSMDLVTMASMLHYVKRPSVALGEARRVLRPGGTLAVVDYVPRAGVGSVMDGAIRLYDRGHVRSRTEAELRAIFSYVGMQTTRSVGFPIDRLCRGVLIIGVVPQRPA